MSSRLTQIEPFRVMDIVRTARAMDNVIHLEIGEPDLPPSPAVQTALAANLDKIAYTNSLGLWDLRVKISAYYQSHYHVSVDPNRIVLTVGTSGAFLITYALLMSAGERLLLTDPAYPCYKNFAHILDIKPIFAPISADNNYQLQACDLDAYDNIKALQISSPSNPTGTVYQPQVLADLISACKQRKIHFIADEIYHGLVYGEAAKTLKTALHYDDEAIVINGFSKYFALPGLRLGWVILPEKMIRQAEILMQNLYISAPTLSQYAALAAFDTPYLQRLSARYAKRRDYLYQALSPWFDLDSPCDGGFYIWANISRYRLNSNEFCKYLLEQAGVAITPGIDFSQHQAQNYVRFAYTRPLIELKQVIHRLEPSLKNLLA